MEKKSIDTRIKSILKHSSLQENINLEKNKKNNPLIINEIYTSKSYNESFSTTKIKNDEITTYKKNKKYNNNKNKKKINKNIFNKIKFNWDIYYKIIC